MAVSGSRRPIQRPPNVNSRTRELNCRCPEVPEPTISKLPLMLMKLMGMASPLIREISSIAYQFQGPWVIDSSETTQALGLRPTVWHSVLLRTVRGDPDRLSVS